MQKIILALALVGISTLAPKAQAGNFNHFYESLNVEEQFVSGINKGGFPAKIGKKSVGGVTCTSIPESPENIVECKFDLAHLDGDAINEALQGADLSPYGIMPGKPVDGKKQFTLVVQ